MNKLYFVGYHYVLQKGAGLSYRHGRAKTKNLSQDSTRNYPKLAEILNRNRLLLRLRSFITSLVDKLRVKWYLNTNITGVRDENEQSNFLSRPRS